ncbi:hypothetical protein GOBAR_DD19744 [Gossypium barbadense]|nr:hypothetical protein GOBAR_DD19744 [Gossypium barbadense]
MEGLVCNLERNPDKNVMVSNSQVVEEGMIVDDTNDVSRVKADGIITKIGYPDSFRVEANGFAGGIWLCWNNDIMVDILNRHSQVVHVKIHSTMSLDNFFCSIVYASPHAAKRRELWQVLNSLAVLVEGHWMLASNFNSIIDTDDEVCRAVFSMALLRAFGVDGFQASFFQT